MNQKVTKREKLCYVLTNIGNVPVQAILGSYLLIFYTNIITIFIINYNFSLVVLLIPLGHQIEKDI